MSLCSMQMCLCVWVCEGYSGWDHETKLMHLTSKPRFWRRDVYSQPTLLSRTSQACVVSANDEPSARLVRRIRLPVTSRNSVGGSMCSLMKEHVLWVRTCLDPTPSLGAATYFSLLYNHIQTSTNLVTSNHSRKTGAPVRHHRAQLRRVP